MTTSNDDRDRATLEAARWVVTLEEHPGDAALRARFADWLSASPENAVAWADSTELYDMMARTPPAHAAHWAPYLAEGGEAKAAKVDAKKQDVPGQQVPERLAGGRPLPATGRGRPRRSSGRRTALGIAAVALAACIAVFVVPPLLLWLEADYVTATAELRSFDLADGSRVQLAPASALAVDIDEEGRVVRLLEGQAYFEVMPDPERPFRVTAGDVTTEVIGTAFDVRLGVRGAAVAVGEGRVAVNHPAATPSTTQDLRAGDWVQVDWDGSLRRGDAPPEEAGSWRQGQIVVRDRPLADAVDDLRRYYAGFIVVTDDTLGARRLSGVYNLADPVAALTAMAGAHDAVVRQMSPWVLVVSPR